MGPVDQARLNSESTVIDKPWMDIVDRSFPDSLTKVKGEGSESVLQFAD